MRGLHRAQEAIRRICRNEKTDMERIFILREWLRREKATLEAVPFGLTEAETEYLRLVGELLETVDGRLLASHGAGTVLRYER